MGQNKGAEACAVTSSGAQRKPCRLRAECIKMAESTGETAALTAVCFKMGAKCWLLVSW